MTTRRNVLMFEIQFLVFLLLLGSFTKPLFHQDLFELLPVEVEVKFTARDYGDTTRFFGNNDSKAVGLFRDTLCRTVAQTEFFRDVGVVTHGKDATRCRNATVGNNHGAVVQGAVLKKDVLNQSLTDVGIDNVARIYFFLQRIAALNNNERADLLFRHIDTRHNDGQDMLAVKVKRISHATAKEFAQHIIAASARTDVGEELADFFLKQYDKSQRTDTDHLIHDAAHEAHVKHLRNEQPHEDEYQDSGEYICGARLLHLLINITKEWRDEHNVYEVFNAKFNHRKRVMSKV